MRDVLRKRAHLVRHHTSQVLSVQNILTRNTGMRFSVKQIHKLNAQDLESLLPEADQVLAVTSSLAILTCLKQQSTTLEKAVSTRLKQTHALRWSVKVFLGFFSLFRTISQDWQLTAIPGVAMLQDRLTHCMPFHFANTETQCESI